jgi:hypothetical protein
MAALPGGASYAGVMKEEPKRPVAGEVDERPVVLFEGTLLEAVMRLDDFRLGDDYRVEEILTNEWWDGQARVLVTREGYTSDTDVDPVLPPEAEDFRSSLMVSLAKQAIEVAEAWSGKTLTPDEMVEVVSYYAVHDGYAMRFDPSWEPNS